MNSNAALPGMCFRQRIMPLFSGANARPSPNTHALAASRPSPVHASDAARSVALPDSHRLASDAWPAAAPSTSSPGSPTTEDLWQTREPAVHQSDSGQPMVGRTASRRSDRTPDGAAGTAQSTAIQPARLHPPTPQRRGRFRHVRQPIRPKRVGKVEAPKSASTPAAAGGNRGHRSPSPLESLAYASPQRILTDQNH